MTMASGFSFSITGHQELQRRLSTLKASLARKIVSRAMRQGAKHVLAKSKALAPVKTGALKRSLKVRALKTRRKGVTGVAVQTGTREELGIPAKSKAYYPAALEFGSENMPAKSYMRAALESQRGIVIRTIENELAIGIEAAATGKGS